MDGSQNIALSKKLKADLLYESSFLKESDVKKLCISSLELFNDLEPDTQANYYNQAICYSEFENLCPANLVIRAAPAPVVGRFGTFSRPSGSRCAPEDKF